MSYIQVKNASVVYNEGSDNQVDALTDINIEIDKNEFVIFFGPSGCGKTTLLNLISGLERISSGEVLVDGENTAELDSDQMAKFHCNKIGMVFQAYNLITSLSVIDNVVLPRIFWDSKKTDIKIDRKKRAQELLDRFGVLAQQNKFPAQLSGGQQQRIGIARALINDQPIILADEPVGNLDSKSAKTVLALLRDLNEKEDKTVIMVTHNAEHLEFADHIFYIKDGKVINETFNNNKKKVKFENLKPEEKEFELLSQAFTGLSEAHMNMLITPFKAKILTNYISSPLDFNQNKRLEEVIAKRLLGDVSKEKFVKLLDKPFEKGGIGLNFQTAKNYFYRIEGILDNTNILRSDLSSFCEKLNLTEEELKAKLLVRYFIRTYLINIPKEQINIFEKTLLERINNTISSDTIYKKLDSSPSLDGAGIDSRIVKKIIEELEIFFILKFSQDKRKKSVNNISIGNKKRNPNLISKDLKYIEELTKIKINE